MFSLQKLVLIFVVINGLVTQGIGATFSLTTPETFEKLELPEEKLYEQWVCDKVKLSCLKNPEIICCDSCKCDFDCTGNGYCCHNQTVTSVVDNTLISKYHCQKAEFLAIDSFSGEEYILVSACNPSETNRHLLKSCFSQKDPADIFETFPVTSESGLSYKNKFCAMCNGETNFTYWKAELKCNDGRQIFGHSFTNVAEQVKLSDNKCNILFYPDLNANNKVQTCGFVNKCKKIHSIFQFSDACIELAPVFHNGDGKLSNRMCFKCQQESISCEIKSFGFSALLNFEFSTSDLALVRNEEPLSTKIDISCSDGKIYDKHMNDCLHITCKPPLFLTKENCSSIYKTVSNVFYELFIKVDILNDSNNILSVCEKCQWNLVSQIESRLEFGLKLMKMYRYYCSFETFIRVSAFALNDSSNIQLEYLLVREKFYFPSHRYVDVVTKLLSTVPKELSIPIDINESEVSLRLAVDGRKYKPFYIFSYKTYLDQVDGNSLFVNPLRKTNPKMDPGCYISDSNWITVNEMLLCPNVNISMKIYNLSLQGHNLCLNENMLCLSPSQYSNHGATVTLCLNQYQKILKAFEMRLENNKDTRYKDMQSNTALEDDIEKILTFIVILLSIVSLSVVLVTYFIFRSLRSMPGLNNMALCFWLVLSHLSLFGINLTHLKIGCVIIGICVHLFWLHTFAWQTICCIHAFRVFASKRQLSILSSNTHKTFISYHIMALVAALIFILINVLVSIIMKGKGNTAYGDNICYISDSFMIAITFALPLLVSVIVNIILILIVIITIKRAPTIQKNVENDHNYLKIFVKLSTMTGLSWIFGFIFQVTKISVFLYLFVISTSLQGMFLMIALVCNKRVFALYKSLIQRKCKPKTSSQKRQLSYTRSSESVSMSTTDFEQTHSND